MVHFCAVFGCGNRSNRDLSKSFYLLPRVKLNQGQVKAKLASERRRLWITRLNRKDINIDSEHNNVCSDHFISGEPAKLEDRETPDWAPSLKQGYESHGNATPKCSMEKYERRAKRQRLDGSLEEKTKKETSELNGTIVQTETTMKDINDMEQNIEQYNASSMSLSMEHALIKCGTIEWFSSNNIVSFYTGLPSFEVLHATFAHVAPSALSKKAVLTPFQELSLTLMGLRLNLTLKDLQYRFDISNSTASAIFLKWISILFIRLKPLIKWPERDMLWETTPVCFRHHFSTKVVVIIDCFEIFINKPVNLQARAATWSNYKHHNTINFLIGIATQGVISFISQAWGGRTTDKFITEKCGILKKLLPGDFVLADRGFDIKESAALYCAEVKLPAFTRGKKQLSMIKVEMTRKIAAVRVHVERVIGNLRNRYAFLQGTLPFDYLIVKESGYTTIDKVAVVASALTNICNSIIPFQ